MSASDFGRRQGRGKSTLFGMALAALILGLSSCGGDEPQPAAPASTATPAATAPVTATTPAATPTEAAPADAATPTEAAPNDAAAAAMAAMAIPDLLKAANLAVDEQRLVSPPGNNAVEYFLAVAEREPGNMQATQALVDIFPMVATVAEREIAQRRVEEAERIVALLDKASPGSYTVTTIRTKLDAARVLVQREQEQQLAAQQARQQAAEAAAAEAAAATASTPASTTPASTAATRPAAATPTTPAPQQTATPTTPEPAAPVAAAPAGETRGARPLRQVQPEYPIEAARKRQEGWVELEFTIGTDGRVTEVSVLRAQPARVFNREATRAMQQWTFEPALENGQAVVSRERRRIEFQL